MYRYKKSFTLYVLLRKNHEMTRKIIMCADILILYSRMPYAIPMLRIVCVVVLYKFKTVLCLCMYHCRCMIHRLRLAENTAVLATVAVLG